MRRLLALGALVVLATGCGGGRDAEGPPPGRFVATSRSLTPAAHLFADPVQARIDVIVDRENLDPARVRVRVDFLPYRMVAGLRRSRRDFPHVTRLRYEATIRCLTIACVPARLASVLGAQEGRGERRTFRFDPARVVYDDPDTGKPRQLRRVWWPPLDSISRLGPETPIPFGAGAGAEFQATLAPVLEPDYRLPPPLLGGLLLAAAAALLALPVWLVISWARSRHPAAESAPDVPPLERALRLVERARDAGGEEEQREALEALAYELDRSGVDGQAPQVRRLAWSSQTPRREQVTDLVVTLRGTNGLAV